jgi:hypothetical protein
METGDSLPVRMPLQAEMAIINPINNNAAEHLIGSSTD